MLVVFNIL